MFMNNMPIEESIRQVAIRYSIECSYAFDTCIRLNHTIEQKNYFSEAKLQRNSRN